MDARRFGFDPSLPLAFKFDPTDADLVAHYLLPRAVGLPNPYAHAVIDDDRAGCPPWELMRRHGHAGSDHAFFFGPPRHPRGRASRQVRAGEDGVRGMWRIQKGHEEELVLVRGGGGGGAEIHLKYRRCYLTYRRDDEEAQTTTGTGWAMEEYQITEPLLLPGAVLSRVAMTDRAKKELQKLRQNPQQPGPSDYLADVHAVVTTGGEGTRGGAQDDFADQCGNDGGVMGETPGDHTELLNAGGYYFDEEEINYYLNEGDGNSGDNFTVVGEYNNSVYKADDGNGA